MKIELRDRILWFDGTNEVMPELVSELLLMGVPPAKIIVQENDEDIIKFNSIEEEQIKSHKDANSTFDYSWNIPEEYLSIDIEAFLKSKLENFLSTKSKKDKDEYYERLSLEIREIENRKLNLIFKTIIFIVDKFRSEKIVWGVGRGSSCASLVLFIIGLHMVDPIKYKISASEFFHD